MLDDMIMMTLLLVFQVRISDQSYSLGAFLGKDPEAVKKSKLEKLDQNIEEVRPTIIFEGKLVKRGHIIISSVTVLLDYCITGNVNVYFIFPNLPSGFETVRIKTLS